MGFFGIFFTYELDNLLVEDVDITGVETAEAENRIKY